MRGIQFAKHLTEHLGKVEVVVDIWQESLVCLALCLPIHSMQIDIIELVLNLSPDVVEEILALLVRLHIKPCLKVDILGRTIAKVDLLDTISAEEDVLAVLIHLHTAIAYALDENLCLALAKVFLPKVVASLKSGDIVELLAILGENGIAKAR